MFFGNILYKVTDNEKYYVEGCAYAAYCTSDYKTIHNDIDANNADYCIELNIRNQNFSFFYRDFNIDEYEDTDNEGNTIIKRFKEWNDWYQIPDIKLP